MTLPPLPQRDQRQFVETPSLVRKKEADRFREHPVSKRLLNLIDGLGGLYRVERSFKFTRNRFLCNRFIVTVPLKESNVCHNEAVSLICSALSIPETCYSIFVQQISTATKIHFGFEDSGEQCVIKAYLEFSYDHSLQMEAGESPEPWLLLLAFKWNPGEPSRYVISRYSGLPSYTPRQIHEKITTLFPHTQGGIIMPLVTAILKMYDESVPLQPMWYLDVSEEGTPRHSFDIKTYRARLQIRHVLPFLQELCRHYSIPPQPFEAYFTTIKNHKFGHLSCGIGRDGDEFVAFYHEAYGQ